MTTNDLIREALAEDLGSGDVTTAATVDDSLFGRGEILAKEECVVAGLGVATAVLTAVDPSIRFQAEARDGDFVKRGSVLLRAEGRFASLLKAERTALNFLQRLSGIATLTRTFVRETEGTKTRILDTRKTTPLLRELEKFAVRMGGGQNHRFGLYDVILVKDNHIAACGGSVGAAVRRARDARPEGRIIVEIAKASDIDAALSEGATQLLLDNMTDGEIRDCVARVNGRAKVEVSGGITLERVKTLARTGVDFISVGALTHSARGVDLSFKIGLA